MLTEQQFESLMAYIDAAISEHQFSSHDGYLALDRRKKKLKELLVEKQTS